MSGAGQVLRPLNGGLPGFPKKGKAEQGGLFDTKDYFLALHVLVPPNTESISLSLSLKEQRAAWPLSCTLGFGLRNLLIDADPEIRQIRREQNLETGDVKAPSAEPEEGE